MSQPDRTQFNALGQGPPESPMRVLVRGIMRLKGTLYMQLADEKMTPLDRACISRVGMHLDRAEDAATEICNMQEMQEAASGLAKR